MNSPIKVVDGSPVHMIEDVAAFHEKFNQGYDGKPRVLPRDLFDFRNKFHREEIDEYELEQEKLEDELDLKTDADNEAIIEGLNKQLDALVDSAYVILGTAYLQFGCARFNAAWRRVVDANMAKVKKATATEETVNSGREPKYDIVKPLGWTPPSHSDLVCDHAHQDEI